LKIKAIASALRKTKSRLVAAEEEDNDDDEGGRAGPATNVSTQRGLFVDPEVIAKCLEVDSIRMSKIEATSTNREAKRLKNSAREIAAYAFIPEFLELVLGTGNPPSSSSDSDAADDGDDSEQGEQGEQQPAFMKMKRNKLELLARIFMGVRTAKEISTLPKLQSAVIRFLEEEHALESLQLRMLPDLKI